MVLNRYFITVLIGIIFLGLALPIAFASESEPGPFLKPVPLYDLLPQIRSQMILAAIHRYNPKLDTLQKNRICQAILTESSRYNFDPFFISGVIAAESSFSPVAVSHCAAQGLMQLTDPVIRIMGINNPFDIQENIQGGTRYLNDLRKIFSSRDLVLAAYNAGPGRVMRLQRIPNISETINYVIKVNSLYQRMQSQFQALVHNAIVNSVSFSVAFNVILPDLPKTFLNEASTPIPSPIFTPLAYLYETRKKIRIAKQLTPGADKGGFEFSAPDPGLYPYIG